MYVGFDLIPGVVDEKKLKTKNVFLCVVIYIHTFLCDVSNSGKLVSVFVVSLTARRRG